MTYKAVGRSFINYTAPVWSTNLRDTNYRNIQYTQNEALRLRATICTVFGLMSGTRKCLPLHHHKGNPKRRMKETLFTRHRNSVEPMMLANNRKATLQAIHSDAVNNAFKDQKKNIVLDGLPHPINDSEKDLRRNVPPLHS